MFAFRKFRPSILLLRQPFGLVRIAFVNAWNEAGNPIRLWPDGLRFMCDYEFGDSVITSAHGAIATFSTDRSRRRASQYLVVVSNSKVWVLALDGKIKKSLHSADGQSVVLTSRRAYILRESEGLCRTVRCGRTIAAMTAVATTAGTTVDDVLRAAAETEEPRDGCIGAIFPALVFATFFDESQNLRATIEFAAAHGSRELVDLDPWQEELRRVSSKPAGDDEKSAAT